MVEFEISRSPLTIERGTWGEGGRFSSLRIERKGIRIFHIIGKGLNTM